MLTGLSRIMRYVRIPPHPQEASAAPGVDPGAAQGGMHGNSLADIGLMWIQFAWAGGAGCMYCLEVGKGWDCLAMRGRFPVYPALVGSI